MTINKASNSILELGSTHMYLAVYKNSVLNQSSFYLENIDYTRNENSLSDKPIINLITKAEKNLNKHLNEITLLLDSYSIFSLDCSIQKTFDKKKISHDEIDYLINECENIVKTNNIEKEILHIFKSQIIIDGKKIEYQSNFTIEAHKVIIELKFVMINKNICDVFKKLFLKKHITIKNIYCTSYFKSLEIINKNKIKGYCSFIDIGLKKSSLSIFKANQLLYINNTYVGGDHITKDISKVLKYDYRKAEAEKFRFSKRKKSEDFLIDNKEDELLKKIINSRLEEIIELLFIDCPITKNLTSESGIKLYFIGNGSKVLTDNLLSFGPEFNFINEMSIIEEYPRDCCDGVIKYFAKNQEVHYQKQSLSIENKGFFEKLFEYFLKK